MGCIISHVDSIDRIRFVKLRTGRPEKVVRALDLGNGGVLLELENKAYSIVGVREGNSVNGNWAVMGFGTSAPSKAVLDGLASMGVITRDDVKAHVERVTALRAKDERKWAKKSLADACETLGIPVPEVAD